MNTSWRRKKWKNHSIFWCKIFIVECWKRFQHLSRCKKRNLKKKKENKITFIRIQKGTLLKKLRISKIVDVNQNEVVRFTKMKTSLRGWCQLINAWLQCRNLEPARFYTHIWKITVERLMVSKVSPKSISQTRWQQSLGTV